MKLVQECIEDLVPDSMMQVDETCPDGGTEKVDTFQQSAASLNIQQTGAGNSDTTQIACQNQVMNNVTNTSQQIDSNEVIRSSNQRNFEKMMDSETRTLSESYDEVNSTDREPPKPKEDIRTNSDMVERELNKNADSRRSILAAEKSVDVSNEKFENNQMLVDQHFDRALQGISCSLNRGVDDVRTEISEKVNSEDLDGTVSDQELSAGKMCHTSEKRHSEMSKSTNNGTKLLSSLPNLSPGGSTVQVKKEPSDHESKSANDLSESSSCKSEQCKPNTAASLKVHTEKKTAETKKNASVLANKTLKQQPLNNKGVRELLLEGRPVLYQPVKTQAADGSTITVVVTDPSQPINSNSLAPLPKSNIIQKKTTAVNLIKIQPAVGNSVVQGRYQLDPCFNRTYAKRTKAPNILPKTILTVPSVNGGNEKTMNNGTSQITVSLTPVHKEKKNVIPAYRAPTPPPQFSEGIPKGGFECKACCDSFLFESSLTHHKTRRSVYITYKCDNCNSIMVFYNKCALIYHLHSHSTSVNGKKFSVRSIPQHLIQQSVAPVPPSCVPLLSPTHAHRSPPILHRADGEHSHSNSVNGKEFSVRSIPQHLIKQSVAPVPPSCVPVLSPTRAHRSPPILLRADGEPAVNMVKPSTSDAQFELKCTECDIPFPSHESLKKHFTTTGKWIKCILCSLYLPNACSLRAHTRIHNHFSPHVCPECGEIVLVGNEAFEKHLQRQCFHINRKCMCKCPECSFLMENQTGEDLFVVLCQHMQNAHGNTYFKCESCPMAFKTLQSFKKHFKRAHENKACKEKVKKDPLVYKCIYKCPMCDTVFHNVDQLPSHIRHHLNDYPNIISYVFKCVDEHCSQTFSDKGELSKHIQEKHDQKVACVYVCSVCGQDFKSREESEKHTTEAHPTKLDDERKLRSQCQLLYGGLHCPLCKCNFSSQNMLIKHKRTAHRDNYPTTVVKPKAYSKQGPQKTQTKKMLEQTVVGVKSGVKNRSSSPGRSPDGKNNSPVKNEDIPIPEVIEKIQCFKCDSSFSDEEKLDEHLKAAHNIVKQYPCQLCGFTYTTPHDLKVHVKVIHEGRKEDYICWLCQEANVYKAYTKRQLLEKHIIGFHKIPKYAVDYSKMKSLDESVNEDHTNNEEPGVVKRRLEAEIANVPTKRLKVDGESNFTCSKCQFSTEDKELFQNHIAEHKDAKESLQCPECGMCFVVQPSLKKHLFIVHKIRNTSQYISESGMKNDCMEGTEEQEENSLECNVCYKSFETVALLRTHMRSHGMAFIRKSRRAQSVHTNGN